MTGDWKNVIAKLAPTVASAIAGPAAGVVVSQIGALFGLGESAKSSDLQRAIESGQLTGEQIAALRELELRLQAEEKELGFRYAELEFLDRDSARQASVSGGTMMPLFGLSTLLLSITLGAEIYVLMYGIPPDTSEIVIGRVLGLLDAIAMTVIAFWYGSSHGSVRKTDMMAESKS